MRQNYIINNELDLDFTLVRFGGEKWRIRDAFEGVQIFGGIGSGKTSGSGKTIARAFLKNGFGGLVMCAKKGEAVEWLEYAISTNRWEDIIVFGKHNKFEIWSEYLKKKERFKELKSFNNQFTWDEGNENRFNPLQYEMTREGEGAGEVFNLSNLFMEIYKMGNRFSGGGGSGKEDRYWDNALKRCINRMIELLKLADEVLSIENMRRIISDALNEEEASSISEKTAEELVEWGETNFCIHCIIWAREYLDEEDEQAVYNYNLVNKFFTNDFAKLEDKSKSIIRESFLGLAEPFLSGILKKYFSEETTLKPEITFEGKVIILDFSVKEYLQAGVYAQGIYKLLWQQAIERRDTDLYPLPAFLWVDESQYFVNEYDTIFQTTARSSRACTVFLTQNISNYYSQMGGESSKSKVNSLLGNLSTKIFHANNDSVTNEWASKVIGHDLINIKTRSEQRKRTSIMNDSITTANSVQFLPQVFPMDFTTLASGGKAYDYLVQAIVIVRGREWESGENFIEVEFYQID